MAKGWIAVDLDGTLAVPFEGDFNKIGPPQPHIVRYVKRLIFSDNEDVRIFTARVAKNTPKVIRMQELLINKWCIENLGVVLPICCEKDMYCKLIIDDLAINPKDIH